MHVAFYLGKGDWNKEVLLAVPAGDFQIVSLCWHPSGDSMALLSKDNLCVCYLGREEVK